MQAIVDNKTVHKLHLILVVSTIAVLGLAGVAGAMSDVQDVVAQLQEIVDNNPGTDLTDEAEDALAKAQTALDELTKTPPDYQAAVRNIEGAVGNLEAAVKDGLLDPEQGAELMNLLTCAAWQLGAGAIWQAIDCEADEEKIAEAQQALAEGEQLWLDGAYEDAVGKYKDALAKAEGVISAPIDPLAGLVTHDLVSEDDKEGGKALLCYDENTNETHFGLKFWNLPPETQYTFFLFECDQDGDFTGYIPIGKCTTNEDGNGYLNGCQVFNRSEWGVAGELSTTLHKKEKKKLIKGLWSKSEVSPL